MPELTPEPDSTDGEKKNNDIKEIVVRKERG
jgi:hypothetical protein